MKNVTSNNSDREAMFYESGAELFQELTLEQQRLFHKRLDEQYPNGHSWEDVYSVLQAIL